MNLKRIMFNKNTNEFYGDGMIPISREECYRFVNFGSRGVKCPGGENGYAIYGYR